MKTSLLLLAAALVCSSCQKTCEKFEPNISFYPNPCLIESRPSAFSPLCREERATDWGKQMRLAYAFGLDQDYYRAITAFKSALVFLPPSQSERKLQIEYGIFQSYYLASKFKEAVEYFEESCLLSCSKEFPAYRDLLIMLYESYSETGECEKSEKMLELISLEFPETATDLELSSVLKEADIPRVVELSSCRPDSENISDFIGEYYVLSKSDWKAQMYQALLPGAGYLYVGQKDAARTSLIINVLFTWAAYRFFEKGYFAAGMITASLEAGWYIGGINGARLAAKEYNERLYGMNGQALMKNNNLFPILMLETTF